MPPFTVFITGASSGIGLELAVQFARRGHPLILLARATPALEAAAHDLRARFPVRVDVLHADSRANR